MVVGGRELIDTLWNVNNAINSMITFFNQRINRYIMECKYRNKFSSTYLALMN